MDGGLIKIFPTRTNRSFTKTIHYTSRDKNSLAVVIGIISVFFLAAMHFISFSVTFFSLQAITSAQFWLCFVVAFASVMWFEM